MTAINKNKPVRDKNYLRNICKRGCVITGQPAIPHHLKGYGQGTAKASDHLAFPLSDKYHSEVYETGLHRDIKKWEKQWGLQVNYIKQTLDIALKDGDISAKDWEVSYAQCIDLQHRFRT